MKPSIFLIAALALAAFAGASCSRQNTSPDAPPAKDAAVIYQCPMHPQVKSDKPGKCTICGMQLVPVGGGGASSHGAASTSQLMLPPGAVQAAGIRTATVAKAPLKRTLRVSGMIDDDATRHRIISARLDGRIERLFVNYDGAEVKAGQPLATFYSRDLNARIAEYRALAKSPGHAADLTALRARLKQFDLTDAQIDALPQRGDDELTVEIPAPMSGTVVKRDAYEGMMVKEGDTLFEIGDFSKMWFVFDAYEQDLPWLKAGQAVQVRATAVPGQTLEGKIAFIDPNLDEMKRAAKVRVVLENPFAGDGDARRRLLSHKLFAEGEVALDAPETQVIPRSAVVWPGGQPRVFVKTDTDVYQPVAVKLGRVGDDAWELLNGPPAGHEVVVSGGVLLDGQAQLTGLELAAPLEVAADATANDYLGAIAGLSRALANDDLDGYRKALTALPPAPEVLGKLPALTAAQDLKSARLEFLAFNTALASALKEKPELRAGVKAYQCPMTNSLGGNAAANGRWLQLAGEAMRNPYFGKAMADCGEEVK